MDTVGLAGATAAGTTATATTRAATAQRLARFNLETHVGEVETYRLNLCEQVSVDAKLEIAFSKHFVTIV